MVNNHIIFYSGIAERVGKINQLTNRDAEVVILRSFVSRNIHLMFAYRRSIVISLDSWNYADTEKKLAMACVFHWSKSA